jgi:beta-phosphoglucomutase
MSDFKAVLFDMDGTLTHNAGFHEQAWARVLLERYQYTLEPNEPRIHGGKTKWITESLLGRTIDEDEALEFHEFKERTYRDFAKGRIAPIAGLESYINALRASGITMALVTSADRTNTDFVLNALRLEDAFAVQVLGSDVRNGKPHPEPFLLAAKTLNLEPHQCLVHEDSLAGVKSALDAGCTVAALTTTHTRDELLKVGAEYAVADYLDWQALGVLA